MDAKEVSSVGLSECSSVTLLQGAESQGRTLSLCLTKRSISFEFRCAPPWRQRFAHAAAIERPILAALIPL